MAPRITTNHKVRVILHNLQWLDVKIHIEPET